MHCRWDTIKGGKSGAPLQFSRPSPYVNMDVPEVSEIFRGIEDRFWRDVATRPALEEAFQRFVSPKSVHINARAAEAAWSRVDEKFAHLRSRLRPISIGESWDGMPKSTSPGLPAVRLGFSSKWDASRAIKRDVRTWWRQFSSTSSGAPLVFPCMPAARRVVREKPANKPRLVWVYPGSNILLEGQFAQPLFAALSDAEWIGWTVNWLDGGRSRGKMFPPAGTAAIASIDISSFDANVLRQLIIKAFSIIRSLFTLTSAEHRAFDLIVDYFIHTPMLFFDGIVQKHRGIPSGSYFTQTVGTIVNMFYSYYVDEVQSPIDGPRLSPSGHLWLGDDSRLLFSIWYGAYDFYRSWVSRYSDVGGTVSADKFSLVVLDGTHENIGTFLSRKILVGYPHLEFNYVKFLAQILIPEDEDASVGMFCARLIGLAWAYGYDRRAWRVLDLLYIHGVEPVYTDRLLRMFRFGLGMPELDYSEFPSFERVRRRYFGYD